MKNPNNLEIDELRPNQFRRGMPSASEGGHHKREPLTRQRQRLENRDHKQGAEPLSSESQIAVNLDVFPGSGKLCHVASQRGFMLHKHRTRREKMFGEGRLRPLDRNAKVRIMTFARVLSHKTEKGKAYGLVTAKFLHVLDALLWGFHNAGTGRCFPSYERIAERAGCTRSTVYFAIHALERAGIMTWVNRIHRVREWGPDLFGRALNCWRILRTSNAYTFNDPKVKSSKSDFPTGTAGSSFNTTVPVVPTADLDPANPLHRALMRFSKLVKAEEEGSSEGRLANAVP